MYRDIHQDNGELLKAASKIRSGERPAVCPLDNASQQQQQGVPAASSAPAAAASSVAAGAVVAAPSVPLRASIPSNAAFPSASIHSHEFLASASSASVSASSVAPAFASSSALSAVAPAVGREEEAQIEAAASIADFNAQSHLAVPHSGNELYNNLEDVYDGDDNQDDDEEEDGSCTNGRQRCEDEGSSSAWLTCSNGEWLKRSCTAGLVCYDGHGMMQRVTKKVTCLC